MKNIFCCGKNIRTPHEIARVGPWLVQKAEQSTSVSKNQSFFRLASLRCLLLRSTLMDFGCAVSRQTGFATPAVFPLNTEVFQKRRFPK